MKAVRIVKRLESDTPHLPELRPFAGRLVEIIVLDLHSGTPDPEEFWRNRSIEEHEAMQGLSGPTDLSKIWGGWPNDQLDDGFEEAMEEWRSRGRGKQEK